MDHLARASEIEALLAATRPFVSLPSSEYASLARQVQLRLYRDRETIFNEGEAASAGWLVVHGVVRILGFMGGDRLMELERVGDGEVFGLFCRLGAKSRNYPCTAQAEGPVKALRIPDAVFDGFYERFPSVSRQTCELLSCRMRVLRGMVPFTRESVEKRVIKTLLELHRDAGPRVRITRQGLATRVGAAIETVFRTLGRLREAGLLRTGRGVVTITDPAGLARRLKGLRA